MDKIDTASFQNNLQKLIKKHNLDAFYISSFDVHFNEYVPDEECHRTYFTGFTGSVAEVLVPKNGLPILFVDGRYHEQASLEVDPKIATIEKVPYGTSLESALLAKIKSLKIKKLGIEGERSPFNLTQKFCGFSTVESFSDEDMASILSYKKFENRAEIFVPDQDFKGNTTGEKICKILKKGEALFLNSLDQVAWLLNLRSISLPYQTTFCAKVIASTEEIWVFTSNTIKAENKNAFGEIKVNFISEGFSKISEILTLKKSTISKMFYDPESTSFYDYSLLEKFFNNNLIVLEKGLRPWQKLKTLSEVKAFEQSFDNADKAILNSLTWLKNQLATQDVSEKEWANQVWLNYQKQGAKALSFKTIAGFGPNSSVIHYSNPSDKVFYKDGQFALLDSGGHFKEAMATDTTRTIIPKGSPTQEQKKIYTLVLKGLLNVLYANFTAGTSGIAIDALARAPLLSYGYNYSHGTGHGIGISVHEWGYSLTPFSSLSLHEGLVGSLEPGIYIPGQGGVRLENVVIVEKHPEHSDLLHFRSLVYIGFQESLIDKNLLGSDGIKQLENYHEKCHRRGRLFL